ncbi:MAG: KTSC domain-containing protein [Chloroflexia bacterium]
MSDLQPVESSMIEAVGYDPDTRELEVLFNSGKLYIYEGVEPTVYEGLMHAESKGQFTLANVIDIYSYHLQRKRRR